MTVQRRVSNVLAMDECQGGKLAAEIFTLFDEGVHPVDAVKRLRLRPADVTVAYRQWAERGGMLVPETQVREMCARFMLTTPVRDAVELVKYLVRAWPKGTCAACET